MHLQPWESWGWMPSLHNRFEINDHEWKNNTTANANWSCMGRWIFLAAVMMFYVRRNIDIQLPFRESYTVREGTMLYLDKPLYHGKEEVTRIVNIDGFVVQSLENDSLKSSIREITEQFRLIFDYILSFVFFCDIKVLHHLWKFQKGKIFSTGVLELWNINFYFYFSGFVYSS